ncbi:hypothetical protein EDD18DRAFT_522969 [Armillaria luteobubalina]|uniref:DUF6535 domain-containing protein n=1 Tax=Armillaria luteobubalina TaxID=153913 RepID=A0AA39UTH5_9AGAR|nr:hypothetical protein EDD18DRAFT_522969 [Armillaria luteobubalina]
MKRSNPMVKKGNGTYDYERKYPEDATYEETAPNARVWKVHEDESKKHDANIVGTARDDLDLLLVFAGLFSAIVTTFVAQTYQNLQPDYPLCRLLFSTNRSSFNVLLPMVPQLTPSPLLPQSHHCFCSRYHGCLGEWTLVMSLFLSLMTALIAFIVNHWLRYYAALPSGTPRDRSLTRQFRYAGFQKWHVQVILGLLPFLLHLALAIFLVAW